MKVRCGLGLLALVSSVAHAGLVWDESVQGDLSTLGTAVGALTTGTHEFVGTFSLHRSGGGTVSADSDSALFDLLDGFAITGMRASITRAYGYGVFGYTRVAGLKSPANVDLFYTDMQGTDFYNFLPIADVGSYRMYTGGGSASIADDVDFYWDWRIEVDVWRVPEPSSLALVLIAVLPLASRWLVPRRPSTVA